MAEVVLFHHAYGLNDGCRQFADRLRADGHVVHTPDLYEGRVYERLDEGVAHADGLGMEVLLARGGAAVAGLPTRVVYAGFSLGTVPAQMLAQTRAGARGALLCHGALPAQEFGPWPGGVALQVHTTEGDEWVDLDQARALVAGVPGAVLHVYPGDRHLFADPTLDDYDEEAATLLGDRVRSFLSSLG